MLASQLVQGDLLVVEEGNNISTDAHLIEAYQMKIDSSTITGESKPIRKISESDLSNETVLGATNLILAVPQHLKRQI